MSKQIAASYVLEAHMKALESEDGQLRQSAREALVALGGKAVTSLARALGNAKEKQVRWEAAKALSAMGEVRAIPALVSALEDSDSDVIWVAAEALSAFGKEAWPALLQALIAGGTESAILRKSAHHVFAKQKQSSGGGVLASLLTSLLAALEAGALPEAAPMVASEMLQQLNAPA